MYVLVMRASVIRSIDRRPVMLHGCIPCREAALAAVTDFIGSPGVAAAAAQLYLLEAALLAEEPNQAVTAPAGAGKAPATEGSASAEEALLACRLQLLAVVGEAVLDEGMPAASVPFAMRLFRDTAERMLPAHPAVKVPALWLWCME